ncbi:MAG TPA: outer membrane protein assembly factor BamE [Burkholderiaceae bacterium]|nr:outer membrane protein assembly factor BamE [Burkholderiaceae bacterium]
MPGRLVTVVVRLPALIVLSVGSALCGCSAVSKDGSVLGFITPYRIDIVQGNVVTKEQLALVRPGMTRVQVRDLLGSPLLTDPFHADRWDYVFTIDRPGTQPQRRSVIVLFEGDRLQKIDAPELPSEREFVALISRTSASGKNVVLELTPEQVAALPAPPKLPAPTPEPEMGPVRTYPPLEPN